MIQTERFLLTVSESLVKKKYTNKKTKIHKSNCSSMLLNTLNDGGLLQNIDIK